MQVPFNLVLCMQSSLFAYAWIFIKWEKLETKQIKFVYISIVNYC